MPQNMRSLISAQYALCFQQKVGVLRSDNDNGAELAVTATANDNAAANPLDNAIVTAALRLFAQHGLASAQRAVENAESCFWANDPLGHKWWMAVLRQLDNNLVASTQGRETDNHDLPINITGNS